MKILSIHDGHNSSAAILENEKILACVSEERLNREKFYWGWPELSIKEVLSLSEIDLGDIDVITVSHLGFWKYSLRKVKKFKLIDFWPNFFIGHFYNIYQVWKRERRVRRLAKSCKKGVKIFFCDHHLAHAASAYYYSGFSDALVVTLDALGDGLSHTAYKVKSGNWEKIIDGGSAESLGEFYAALTESLGFKRNRHEGKVVGLAAFGDANKIKSLNIFPVRINSDCLHFKRMGYWEMVKIFKDILNREEVFREDLAAFGQELLEDLTVKHIRKLLEISGFKKIAVAGGVFANVKLNQRIMENCFLDDIFIQPAMGDEGLILGSAGYYLRDMIGTVDKLRDVYWGRKYKNKEVENILKKSGFKYEKVEFSFDRVAELIRKGKIVGWFDGRMEFGPRALGARSILIDPRNKEINNSVNKRLKRSEFMPFAPSVLYEKAEDVFEGTKKALHSAEFMTISLSVKEEWRNKIGAVVHIDGTARPQLVRKEVNENYYKVINSFFEKTGIPLVVNTSFNMHEEPIVCSVEDAIRSFRAGAVDVLVFNNRFFVYGD